MFYESYLNSIKPDMSFIPEAASFKDMSIFTERAIQDAFNETFIGMAMQEMTMYSALNEADGDKPASTEEKKKKLDKIKEIFGNIWKAIKGYFFKAIDKVKEIYTKFRVNKGKVIEKDFKNSLESLKKSDASKTFKAKMIGAGVAKAVADSKSDFDAIAKYASEMSDELMSTGAFADSSTEFGEKYSVDKIKENLGKLKTFEREIQAKEYGFDQVYKNPYITQYVFSENTILKQLKDEYTKAKDIIDSLMKTGKDIVNGQGGKKEATANINLFVKGVAVIGKTLTSVSAEYLGYAKKIRSNYVAIVSKVIVSAKRAVKEDTEISIDVDGSGEDSVEVNAPETAPTDKVEVKDEVEEAFAAFLEEDEPAEGEVEVVAKTAEDKPEEVEASVDQTVKEDGDVEINIKVEDEDEDEEESVEESTLYRALVAYLD